MNSTPIVCSQLSKCYKNTQAFRSLGFTLQAGHVLALVGPNGAGKSSLIKCLLGLTKPTAGSVTLFGRPVSDPLSRKGLGYLPERFSPPAYVTGIEYLKYIAHAHGQPFELQHARTLLAQLNFPIDALSRLTGTYSKGMCQKIGLCSLLVSACRLLILDEPMSGLDPEARYLLRQHIQKAVASGVTVLISTHALDDIPHLNAHVLALHRGIQQFFGSYTELLETTAANDIEGAYLALCSDLHGHRMEALDVS